MTDKPMEQKWHFKGQSLYMGNTPVCTLSYEYVKWAKQDIVNDLNFALLKDEIMDAVKRLERLQQNVTPDYSNHTRRLLARIEEIGHE